MPTQNFSQNHSTNYSDIKKLMAGNQLETLRLSREDFFEDEFVKLLLALSVNSSVKNLIIGSNTLTRSMILVLCDVLAVNKTISLLDITHCELKDDEFYMILCYLIRHPSLNSLLCKKNTLDLKSLAALTHFLEAETTQLKQLICCSGNDFHFNESILFGFLKAVFTKKTLQEFEMNWCLNTDEHISFIADLLKDNKSMTILRLPNNFISNDGAQSLAYALHSNDTLEHLEIYHNAIGNEGVNALAKAIEDNPNCALKYIDISLNDINKKYLKNLEEVCQKKSIKLVSGKIYPGLRTPPALNQTTRHLEKKGDELLRKYEKNYKLSLTESEILACLAWSDRAFEDSLVTKPIVTFPEDSLPPPPPPEDTDQPVQFASTQANLFKKFNPGQAIIDSDESLSKVFDQMIQKQRISKLTFKGPHINKKPLLEFFEFLLRNEISTTYLEINQLPLEEQLMGMLAEKVKRDKMLDTLKLVKSLGSNSKGFIQLLEAVAQQSFFGKLDISGEVVNRKIERDVLHFLIKCLQLRSDFATYFNLIISSSTFSNEVLEKLKDFMSKTDVHLFLNIDDEIFNASITKLENDLSDADKTLDKAYVMLEDARRALDNVNQIYEKGKTTDLGSDRMLDGKSAGSRVDGDLEEAPDEELELALALSFESARNAESKQPQRNDAKLDEMLNEGLEKAIAFSLESSNKFESKKESIESEQEKIHEQEEIDDGVETFAYSLR